MFIPKSMLSEIDGHYPGEDRKPVTQSSPQPTPDTSQAQEHLPPVSPDASFDDVAPARDDENEPVAAEEDDPAPPDPDTESLDTPDEEEDAQGEDAQGAGGEAGDAANAEPEIEAPMTPNKSGPAPDESPRPHEEDDPRDANTTEAIPTGGSAAGLGLNKKGVTSEAEEAGSMNASQAVRRAEGQGANMSVPSFGFAQLLANGLLMPFHAIQGLLRPLTQRGPSWTPKTFSLDQASVDGFRNRRADEALKTYQASGKHLDKVMESLVDTRKNEDIAQLIGKLRAAPSEEARQALIGQALKTGRITNRKVADMWENVFTAMETHRDKAHDAMAAAANAGRKDAVEQIHAQWASRVEGIQKNNAWMDTMTNGEFSKRMRDDAQKMAEKVKELVESIVKRLRAMFGHGDEGGPAPTA